MLRSLLETHSVARTAAALALTPSAVSHALGRLRATLGDDRARAYTGTSANVYRRALFSEHMAVLARADHPRVKRGRIALDDYLAASHVLIAPRGRPGGPIDRLLAEQGRARRVSVLVPSALLAPYVVAETQLLLSAGEGLLRSFVGALPVQVVPLPFELPAFDVNLVWHARVHGDPACAWFRNQLVAVHDEVRATRRASGRSSRASRA